MEELKKYLWRKKMPSAMKGPILEALSYYPELLSKHITFKYTKRAGTSIMKAQPLVKSMLQMGVERGYVIYMNENLQLGGDSIALKDVPREVLVGWIGHELGHVMDYEQRSDWGLLRFGLGYLLSKKYIRKAEQRADEFAVKHGLGNHILKTKNYILNHAGLSEKYKNKIRKLYLSPEQIMEIVKGEKDLDAVA